jgi:hypothetical protein
MKSVLALLVVGACVATPCSFAAERFTSDKPTPLKQLSHRKDDGNGVRFGGSVQLTGQFFMVWKQATNPEYRQITFYPDAGSAALLPHPADEKPVTELDFTNREQAAAMLRDLVTVEKPASRGEVGATGAATVTIRNYRTEVECDHRYYLAELVSVVKDKQTVAASRDARPGC